MIRSQGGWSAVKALRRSKSYQKGDERILGDSDFVEKVLSKANEQLDRKYHLKAQGIDFEKIATRVSDLICIAPEQILLEESIDKLFRHGLYSVIGRPVS